MKKKIAIFRDTDCHFNTPCDTSCVPKEYVRITDWVEIDFKERDKDELIIDEVNSINKKINKIKEETIKKIEVLSTRKEELLALEVNHEN